MRVLLLILLFLSSFAAFAVDEFQSKIHSIDLSPAKGEAHLIMFENGRVVFVERNDNETLKAFQESLRKQETLELEVDEKSRLLSAETINPDLSTDADDNDLSRRFSFDPTILSSGSAAAKVFKRMRRDYQNDSQCYNRAHIWAFEEYRKTGLKSKKHFLFFTSRYIRNYNYKWWFHVAPSVIVKGRGVRILDRRYTGGHRSVFSWTRNFVYSGRKCPVVQRYSDYRNNQEREDCFLIPVSMYFWQPRDIEKRDSTGYEKTTFIRSEVDYAYWEAF